MNDYHNGTEIVKIEMLSLGVMISYIPCVSIGSSLFATTFSANNIPENPIEHCCI